MSVFFVISGFLLARSLTLDSSLVTLFALVMLGKTRWPPLAILLAPVLAYLVIALAYMPSRWLGYYRRVGDYSYGTYLWGFPLQQVMVATLPRMIYGVCFLVALLVTLIPAAISWHLIEARALTFLKSRLLRSHQLLRSRNSASASATTR